MSSLSQVFQEVLAVLDRTETPFLVGGSVASGTHGIPRYTKDIDLVIDLPLDQVQDFCDAFRTGWFVDPAVVSRAIRRGHAFNLIHIATAYKFDFFPIGNDAFGRTQLARRRYSTSRVPGLEGIEFPVASVEDTILAKLVWFRKGGKVSDSQWRDVLGVIQVKMEQLDHTYLDQWAAELGVSDLLIQALQS